MKRHHLVLASAFVSTVACSQPANNGENNGVVVIDDNGTNNGANNGGVDAGEDTGGGADLGDDCRVTGCAQDLVCNATDGRCVECVADAECGQNGSCDPEKNECVCDTGFHECAGACVALDSVDGCGATCEVCPVVTGGTRTCDGTSCGGACTGDMQYDPDRSACVGCVSNADCTDAAFSSCFQDVCDKCGLDSDCDHIAGRPFCGASGCSECTIGDETACGTKSCDAATGNCTQTDRGSVGVCEACLSDSECMPDHLCMPLEFQGAARPGGFCMPVEGAGCSAPYPIVVSRRSLSGVTESVCVVNEALTTCEAVADYFEICTDAADCGAQGLDDALCEPVDFDRAGCTYPCDSTEECTSATFIGCASGAVDKKWCGAY